MEITTYETVGGAYIVNDEDEDGPLARVEFYAEAKALEPAEREKVVAATARAIVRVLGTKREGYNFMVAYETPQGMLTPYLMHGRAVLYGDDEYAAQLLDKVRTRDAASADKPWRVIPIEA